MDNFKTKSTAGRAHLAAICTECGDTADKVINRVIATLRGNGTRIVGLRQHTSVEAGNSSSSRLQDLETGSTHDLSRRYTANSSDFTVNCQDIEVLANTLLKQLAVKPDLVMFNRFGQCESDGVGFCGVIERAIALDIPVLTVVNSRWQQCWHDYSPGQMTTLPARYACVLEWCHKVIKQQKQTGESTSTKLRELHANV